VKIDDGEVLVERSLTEAKLAMLRKRRYPEARDASDIGDGTLFDGKLYVGYPVTSELQVALTEGRYEGVEANIVLRRDRDGRYVIEEVRFADSR